MKKLRIIGLFLFLAFLLPYSNAARAEVRGPLVVSERWPECTDMLTWLDDIFRLGNVEKASERDRAVVFHNRLRLFNRLCESVGGMAHAFEAPGEPRVSCMMRTSIFSYTAGVIAARTA